MAAPPVHPGASGSAYAGAPKVRRSHAPYRGFCGAAAVPASSIPALAGWGTTRLQLRRPAPQRYDPRLSRPGGWGPLGASSRPWPCSEAHPCPHPTLLPGPPLCPHPVLRLAIPMVRMGLFTLPAEFLGHFPISLCVGWALAAPGRFPFCSRFLVWFTL